MMQEKTRQSLDLLSRNKSEVHPLLPADARTTGISSFSPDHQPSNLPKYHPKKKQHQNPNENLKKITEKVSKSAQAKSPNPPTSLQHPSNIPPTPRWRLRLWRKRWRCPWSFARKSSSRRHNWWLLRSSGRCHRR